MILSRSKKQLIQQAPVTLCQLLSPFTTQTIAETELQSLLSQPLLLDKVIECASQHFVAGALYAQLQHHGLLPTLPVDLRDFLSCQHTFMKDRNQRLKQQLQGIIRLLDDEGHIPQIMKGGDTLFYDLYPTLGCRFMSDFDILLPVGEVPKARATLVKHGYAVPKKYQAIKESPLSHHAVPIYKEGDDCAVELHYHPLSYKADALLTTEMAFANSEAITTLDSNTAQALRLSPTDKVMHCFVHSEICHGFQENDWLDIRQLDYFSRLLQQHKETIDWTLLENRLAKKGHLADFAVYCSKARLLFGWPVGVPLFEEYLPSTRIVEKRYRAALSSAMSQHYPLQRLFYGLKFVVSVFAPKYLEVQFDLTIDSPLDYLKAVSRKVMLLGRRLLKPVAFFRQLKAIFTTKAW